LVFCWPHQCRFRYLFLKRENKASRAQASETIKDALAEGKNIAIYPEGGCYGRQINRFLYGIFTISLETGVPIVPVFIHYEAQEDFEWQGQTLPQKIFELMRAKNNTANYHVFDPFDPKEFNDRESYTNHVHQQYLQWQDKYLK
jgi:1-acyl-sn-glycerol-3-phosphate acyltransferase